MSETVRAFTCWVPELGGDPVRWCGIYLAASSSKARYKCLLNVGDPFPHITITDICVLRARAYDGRAFREGIMPEFIERECPAGGVTP